MRGGLHDTILIRLSREEHHASATRIMQDIRPRRDKGGVNGSRNLTGGTGRDSGRDSGRPYLMEWGWRLGRERQRREGSRAFASRWADLS